MASKKLISSKEINILASVNSQVALSEVINRKLYLCKMPTNLPTRERKGKERREKEKRPANIYTFHILQERMWFQYTYSGDKYTIWNLIWYFSK